MGRIGAVGTKDQMMAFRAIGIDVYPVEDAKSAGEIICKLADEGFSLILVEEKFCNDLRDVFARFATQPVPAILPVPGSRGSEGIALNRLRDMLKRAVGADIFERGETSKEEKI